MNTATRPGFGMRPGENDTAPTESFLPQRSRVDLAAERDEAGIDELMASLDAELVGLHEVKTRIREVAALLLVARVRQRFGVSSTRPNLHMCFTGNPGTGKTTVAMRMAGLLHRIGYLERGHLVAVTRDDLVGQYVGHTAPKTKEVLKRAMGGVLFIDEAYYLYRAENERDYGQESIEILLQVMENQREDVVVILAGYDDRMAEFFHSNPGMSSRVAHHIEFDDYDLDELESIAGLMSEQDGYRIGGEAVEVFRELLDEQRARPRFANARTVRNMLERARLRHASRLVDTLDDCGLDDLVRLEPVDFKA